MKLRTSTEPVASDEQSVASRVRETGVSLSSVVVFVRDMDVSVAFYRDLLDLHVTVREESATLLVGVGGVQLYLRNIGTRAMHPLGCVGVQYVVWTAPTLAYLQRCEVALREAGKHVRTEFEVGVTLLEGRDPSGLPVMIAFPGPDRVARHFIRTRMYTY